KQMDIARLLQPLLAEVMKGLPVASASLDDPLNFSPPISPDPQVSRLASFSDISHLLDSLSCVAIVGYPKSGKTTATAEYAKAHPCSCIWLNASESAELQESWCEVTQLRIARHLNLSGSAG